MPEYIRYGDEWRKEVMKDSKSDIVDMLRDVAIERDKLEAAQKVHKSSASQAESAEVKE